MPELDPAWEYWEPDPEIAELVGRAADGFDGFGLEGFREADRGGLPGVRFGRGNPDRFNGKLAPPKPERAAGRPPGAAAPPAAAARRTCATCGRAFEPTATCRRYCSITCLPQPRLPKIDPARFARLYTDGLGIEAILWLFDVSYATYRKALVGSHVARRPAKNLSARRKQPVVLHRPVAGEEIVIHVPENPRLHGTRAVVRELAPWGAHLDAPAAATGRFRAAWHEMLPAPPPAPVAAAASPSGDLCDRCGGMMVRTGTCLTCQGCGSTSGGCG